VSSVGNDERVGATSNATDKRSVGLFAQSAIDLPLRISWRTPHSQRNDRYRPDPGPSQVGPFRTAIRPTATFPADVSDVRFTSTPVARCAPRAVVPAAGGRGLALPSKPNWSKVRPGP